MNISGSDVSKEAANMILLGMVFFEALCGRLISHVHVCRR